MSIQRSRSPSKILANRSIKLLSGNCQSAWAAEIVIAIAHKDQPNLLLNALASALEQTVIKNQRGTILLLDDSSGGDCMKLVTPFLKHPRVIVISATCGSPSRARNCLLDYVDNYFPEAKWVARLDADDTFATAFSVEALCDRGNESNSRYILGSNNLVSKGEIVGSPNVADEELLTNRHRLHTFIDAFCKGSQSQELTSCNLVLSTHLGARYPNIRSAEDHWLVAYLLVFHQQDSLIVSEPIYANYSLDGHDTQQNRDNAVWCEQRFRLTEAVKIWNYALDIHSDAFLGAGQEGIVWQENNQIVKQFYSWSLTDKDVDKITSVFKPGLKALPYPSFYKANDLWHCRYDAIALAPFQPTESIFPIKSYLKELYQQGLATNNIKRDNLKIDNLGNIVYIDIGKDITTLSVSRFLDMSARLYAIGVLDLPDEEWVRRKSFTPQDVELKSMPGFAEFYRELVLELHPYASLTPNMPNHNTRKTSSVSLMIKACAQDANYLKDQVIHITTQLKHPRPLYEVILLIDSYEGPFLRQHAPSALDDVKAIAQELHIAGLIDRVLIAPTNHSIVKKVYSRWFARPDIVNSHTINNAPLFSQIWGFEQIRTRYVLQCDIDVLVGRKDYSHSYIDNMLSAIAGSDVISIGFNIPKSSNNYLEYEAQPGGYTPEVRFGLLDLVQIQTLLPIDNPVSDFHFSLTWHRALEKEQQVNGLRSLRGGDSRSFYIHPLNQDKEINRLSRIRDIVSNGHYPDEQSECFDLQAKAEWLYPARDENIVVLLKGRNTPIEKLSRCINSLEIQSDQSFGIIFIDDASDLEFKKHHTDLLINLKHKTTVINRREKTGRLPNFIEAIETVCTNPESLIVILDQDDALMRNDVIEQLLSELKIGADLIQLPMFRPNKPTKLYEAQFTNIRQCRGNNVWAHLRSFKKKLFDRVPKEYFKYGDQWISEVTDYTTMVPIAELAEYPVFLDPGYCYLHEREDYSSEVKERQAELLDHVFDLPSLVISR